MTISGGYVALMRLRVVGLHYLLRKPQLELTRDTAAESRWVIVDKVIIYSILQMSENDHWPCVVHCEKNTQSKNDHWPCVVHCEKNMQSRLIISVYQVAERFRDNSDVVFINSSAWTDLLSLRLDGAVGGRS